MANCDGNKGAGYANELIASDISSDVIIGPPCASGNVQATFHNQLQNDFAYQQSHFLVY